MQGVNTVSEFIENNYQVISVCFGLLAAILVVVRVSVLGLKSLVNYIEHEQRNKWQAEFFDINLGTIDGLREEIKELERDVSLLKQTYAACEGKVLGS